MAKQQRHFFWGDCAYTVCAKQMWYRMCWFYRNTGIIRYTYCKNSSKSWRKQVMQRPLFIEINIICIIIWIFLLLWEIQKRNLGKVYWTVQCVVFFFFIISHANLYILILFLVSFTFFIMLKWIGLQAFNCY